MNFQVYYMKTLQTAKINVKTVAEEWWSMEHRLSDPDRGAEGLRDNLSH